MAYKIIFIDEQQTEHDNFKDYIDEHVDLDLTIETEFPKGSIEEMVNSIVEERPDAVITDYLLNDIKEDIKYNVPYSGAELVDALCEQKQGFPCFIMTSHDSEAISQSEDVNIVYVKKLLVNGNDKLGKTSFIEKVIEQIKHYQIRIQTSESRIQELLAKREKEPLNCQEEDELIKLDSFLESAVDKKGSIPEEYKKLSNLQKISDLIEKADILIAKLEGEGK